MELISGLIELIRSAGTWVVIDLLFKSWTNEGFQNVPHKDGFRGSLDKIFGNFLMIRILDNYLEFEILLFNSRLGFLGLSYSL